MTALQAIFRGGRPQLATIENPAVPLTSATLLDLFGAYPAHSGVRVTEHSALGMPAVWRSVQIISGVCAALPLHAYERGDEQRLPLSTGPEADLLADPHPDMTPLELWELVYGSLCLWGNAYLRILRDQRGRIAELWWLAPSRVKAGRAEDGTKVYTLDGNTDPAEALSDRQILHVPGFGYDGVVGVSPIRLHREGIGLAMAAEQFGARLFGSGGLATGILTSDLRIDDTQAEEIKQRWKAGGTGLDSAHDVRVLGSGARYQQLTIPPEDAQFLESRRFQVTEVARMFGIPPHLLAETENQTSWGTGIESQNLGLITFTLNAWIVRVEQRLTKLLRRIAQPLPQPSNRYARYNLAGLLRGDATARAQFYTSLWQLGALSTDDVRALEDLGPVPGGDRRFVPLNMGPLNAPVPDSNPGPVTGAGDPAPTPDEVAAAAALAASNAVQKLYLGVGVVITDEEARTIARRAGAGDDIAAGPLPADARPVPAAPAPVPDQQGA